MSYKLTAYPKDLTLRDGANVIVRPLCEADEDALAVFFRKVPAHDRYFLKDDVTSPNVICRWTSHIDDARALPLVTVEEDRIIANSVLCARDTARMRTSPASVSWSTKARASAGSAQRS